MNRIYLVFILFIMLAACTDSEPENLISEEVYEMIFIELAIIDQVEEVLLGEYSRQELRQEMYAHYGVSAEEFANTHQFYEQNIDEQLRRIDRINDRLRNERTFIDESERDFRAQNRRTAESLREQIFNRSEDDQNQNDIPESAQPSGSDLSVESAEISRSDALVGISIKEYSFNPDGRFSLQVRSFQSLNAAEEYLEVWIERGFESAYVQASQHEDSGETWFRVRLGNLSSLEEVEHLKQTVSDQFDVEAWITNTD